MTEKDFNDGKENLRRIFLKVEKQVKEDVLLKDTKRYASVLHTYSSSCIDVDLLSDNLNLCFRDLLFNDKKEVRVIIHAIITTIMTNGVKLVRLRYLEDQEFYSLKAYLMIQNGFVNNEYDNFKRYLALTKKQ